jgi:hypothetical protein
VRIGFIAQRPAFGVAASPLDEFITMKKRKIDQLKELIEEELPKIELTIMDLYLEIFRAINFFIDICESELLETCLAHRLGIASDKSILELYSALPYTLPQGTPKGLRDKARRLLDNEQLIQKYIT